MGMETFELTKKWAKWANDTSKKIKSTKLSEAIGGYADLASKSTQFRGLNWYKDALQALTGIEEIVEGVNTKFEQVKDADTQLVLASLDKGEHVVRDTKAQITKDEKAYKSAVEKQKKVAEKLQLAKAKLCEEAHALAVKAMKFQELVKSYKDEDVKQLEIWRKGAELFQEKAQGFVEPIKQLKKSLSSEAEVAKSSTVLDDRADLWLLAEKCPRLKSAEEGVAETGKIAKEVHAALINRIDAAKQSKEEAPPLPKTKAPSLPKKE